MARLPWDSKPEVVNAKLWHILVREVSGAGFEMGMRRFYRQRIYGVAEGREVSETLVTGEYDQILGGGKLFHNCLINNEGRISWGKQTLPGIDRNWITIICKAEFKKANIQPIIVKFIKYSKLHHVNVKKNKENTSYC